MVTSTMPTSGSVLLCLSLSLVIFSTFLHPSLSELCNSLDKTVLLEIKTAFNNPYMLYSWDPKTDCCDWKYVLCDDVYHRVYSLSLRHGGLKGPIPEQVGNLPYLQQLELHKYPDVVGGIPNSIAKLSFLRFLQITWTGVTGPIPNFFTSLPNLELVDFSYNSIAGTIPPSLGWLPKLGALRLDRNRLTGSIPDSFGEFKKPDFYLYMSHNRLGGTIPASMAKKDFTYIDLSRNKLTGDPAPLFGANRKILHLDLSRNKFKFEMTNVKPPRTLVVFDLNHNKIFGSLPAELTQLRLTTFNVSYNRMCGRIPYSGYLRNFDYSAFFHNRCLCGPPLSDTCNPLSQI